MTTSLPLLAAAERVGGYRWLDDRLFALTGRWASEPTVPAVQLFLDDVSGQHAWHAQLWQDRLPVLDGLEPKSLTRPRGPVVGPLLEAVEAAGDRPPTTGTTGNSGTAGTAGTAGSSDDEVADDRRRAVARLAGLGRVVWPRLLASYEEHLAQCAVVADRPVIRVLRLVSADLEAACAAAQNLLVGRFASPAEATVASAVQQWLEERAGAAGLFPWEL